MSINDAYTQSKARIKGRLDGHYQHEGVKWMLQRELVDQDPKGGILADDMGLGKTMQAIATMRGNEGRTLIVTLVSTVNQWRDALIEFGGYKPVIINPSFVGSLPSDVDVAITAYSSFQKARPPPCLVSDRWHRIILDEGHTIRNPSTKTYTEISKAHASIKWILSGTPIQNSNKDLLALADWIGIPKGMPVEDIVETFVLRRTQEEHSKKNPRLALPPLSTSVVKLEFKTKAEADFYQAIESHYESMTDTAFEALEALTRCRQACTNPVLYSESLDKKDGKKRKKCSMPRVEDFWTGGDIGCTKLQYLVDDIVDHTRSKGKSLVFCIWTNEMKYLQDALKEREVTALIYDGRLSREGKDAVLYNFKNTSIPVMIIQISCGACGLNLQCANRVYITSPHWNPCVELQAIGRAYRKGQTQKVTCVRMVMVNTVEERCMEIQEKKMEMITNAMKDESLVNRLGALSGGDDVDIRTLFGAKSKTKKKKKKSPFQQNEEDIVEAIPPPPNDDEPHKTQDVQPPLDELQGVHAAGGAPQDTNALQWDLLENAPRELLDMDAAISDDFAKFLNDLMGDSEVQLH